MGRPGVVQGKGASCYWRTTCIGMLLLSEGPRIRL